MKDVNGLIENGVDVKKSLELFGDMNTYDTMLEDFLKEVDGKVASAKRYLEMSDMANYAIIVHSLKSDCRYFGINRLADMFYDHELAGKRSDSFYVRENFDVLMLETKKMLNVLKRYMGVLIDEETPVVSNEQRDVESHEVGSGMIIVVDDSNIIRNFIQKIFAGKYEVVAVNDGQEAIGTIDNMPKERIMCIFLDLNMPGVDGFQVLDHFKATGLFDKVPVSIISGSGDAETVSRVFAYPIVDMLQKPFNENKIRDIAEKMIARKVS